MILLIMTFFITILDKPLQSTCTI